jgi:precorrin-6x reductase
LVDFVRIPEKVFFKMLPATQVKLKCFTADLTIPTKFLASMSGRITQERQESAFLSLSYPPSSSGFSNSLFARYHT